MRKFSYLFQPLFQCVYTIMIKKMIMIEKERKKKEGIRFNFRYHSLTNQPTYRLDDILILLVIYLFSRYTKKKEDYNIYTYINGDLLLVFPLSIYFFLFIKIFNFNLLPLNYIIIIIIIIILIVIILMK